MFALLGIAILLAAFLTANSLASLVLGTAWRIVARYAENSLAETRARTLFLFRVAPAAFSIFVALLLITPSYLIYEPRATSERVSLKMTALAILSLIGIGLAGARGFAAWRATRRLTADWQARGKPIELSGISVHAYLIEHTFPIIAVVGAVRPRLFIARRVVESLTPDEITAALAHESGHLVARDNLKRGLLRACRDALLLVPAGRSLDHAWAEASECAADEYAAREGRKTALDLASALVKIARMVPGDARPTMPVGSFLIGDDASLGLKWRVSHLLQLAVADNRAQRGRSAGRTVFFWGSIASFVVLLAVIASSPFVLLTVHSLMEVAVALLQ